MDDSQLIKSHLKSLEIQLRVIEARVSKSEPGSQRRTFDELHGLLRGQSDSSEAEIDAVLYRVPVSIED
jgi:hypothetical protein